MNIQHTMNISDSDERLVMLDRYTISRELGSRAGFYFSLLSRLTQQINTDVIRLAYSDFKQYTNDSHYIISSTMKSLEKKKYIERKFNTEGNLVTYKILIREL